jgi:AAA15 family ATPase/GTPase
MAISRFSFEEKYHPNWKLNKVAFSDFNLLVGQSGVGKTKIIDALHKVCRAGTESAEEASDCKWEIEVAEREETYVWRAETIKFAGSEGKFIEEQIICNSDIIVDRDDVNSRFLFENKPLPMLNKTQSAISLLQHSTSIEKLHRALTGFIFSVASEATATFWKKQPDSKSVEELRDECSELPVLRSLTDIPLLVRAWILQTKFPDEYEGIESLYKDIFPTVSKVRIASLKNWPDITEERLPLIDTLLLQIEESGVGRIAGRNISSGMARTFLHLAEIALAPSGAVIVVDEFENSLGINCLPQLTDSFLRRPDLQFILTSHHPYVINNIPWRYWKLVTRRGSEVTVKDATSIPALKSASSLEKFTQLLNLEEYEEAIR